VWNEARPLLLIANLLAAAAMLALTLALVAWLAQRSMFALTSVELLPTSDEHALRYVSPTRARAAIDGRLDGNFFTVDLDEARAVFESTPWVRRASVRRVWPGALRVVIEEQQPIALWNAHQLINAWGETFTANLGELDDDANLPLFVAPNGSGKLVVQRYADLVRWLRPLNVQIERLELTPRYAWTVTLSNGLTLDLGRDPSASALDLRSVSGTLSFGQRVERFVHAWPQVQQRMAGRAVTHVDLRYAQGFALTLGDVPDTQSKKRQ